VEQTLILPPPQAMEDFFDHAVHAVGDEHWKEYSYNIGPHSVLLRIAGERLQSFMTEAIIHLRTTAHPNQPYDLTVWAIDEKSMGLPVPDVPWSWHTGDREGYIHGIDVTRFTVNFDHATQSLRFLDRTRNVALHWMRDLDFVPYWERSFPLREILNWWYRDTTFQPVHAAAVGVNGSGALIGARGGSGKSSTALSCLLSEMQFAGDDFVLIDSEHSRAYSLYQIAKLEPHTLERFPKLTPPPGTRMIDQNKFQLSLARLIPNGVTRTLDLKMILVPQITHGPVTTIASMDKSEAASALMLSTIYLLKGDSRPTFKKISALVEKLPAYRLNLGLDFDHIPVVIKNAILNA